MAATIFPAAAFPWIRLSTSSCGANLPKELRSLFRRSGSIKFSGRWLSTLQIAKRWINTSLRTPRIRGAPSAGAHEPSGALCQASGSAAASSNTNQMRPRLLADADLNHKIVVGLRRRERAVDFLGAWEGCVTGIPDPAVLNIAAEKRRILISHDRKTMPRHFAQLLTSQSSPGLLIVAQDLDIAAAIDDLLLIWATTDAEEWVDRIGFVPI